MGNRYRLASNNPAEPAFAVTEAGRMYLLLQTIVDRLHVEGSIAAWRRTTRLLI